MLKDCILALCAEVDTAIHSFKRLWPLYREICCLLVAYMSLGPKEKWLQKVQLFWQNPEYSLTAFDNEGTYSCVYAWVSLLTGRMYVGSTVDFRQRVYSHLRAIRKAPKQRFHKFACSFGRHLFFPIPMLACPVFPLRQVEQAVVNHLQPNLNREWMSEAIKTRKGVRIQKGGQRRLKSQRCKPGHVRPGLCTAQFLPGGLCLPGVASALHYAKHAKLKTFSLRINPGTIHLPATYGGCSMFDDSIVSVEGCEDLQSVTLKQCAQLLKRPIKAPIMLHVHRLAVVGWQWWASQRLLEVLQMPCSVRSWYKLDQKSLVRLWRMAMLWRNLTQRVKLLQLVARVCRTVYSINLRLTVVIRIPFGLQHMHKQLVHAASTVVMGASHVDLEVRKLWCESIRVVQKQGDPIGMLFCNFRKHCRQLNCSLEGEDEMLPYVARSGIVLPTVNGFVSFRGDDPRLPHNIRAATGLHSKFIPTQTGHGPVMKSLAQQFADVYEKMGVQNVSPDSLLPWLQCVRDQSCPSFDRDSQIRLGAVTMEQVMEVHKTLFDTRSGNLVVTVIDKNAGVLYFEDAIAYRARLLSTYIEDTKHYCVVQRSEEQLLNECKKFSEVKKWNKFCAVRQLSSLGYAQCLPKDKDCSLNRPIIPNVKHPLAKLFNMAARGFAFVLMNVRLKHYNLFTTQAFVEQMTECADTLELLFSSGEVVQAVISQSDVKDMYTEISHPE